MLFNFNKKKVTGGYQPNTLANSYKSRTVVANNNNCSSLPTQIGMGGNAGGQNSGVGVSRYSGTTMRMEDGNITQEWMPRDPINQHKLWRQIYLHDSITGPTTDLISFLPWSDYDLIGIKDPEVLKIYQRSMENLRVPTLMPAITIEYLQIGRVIASLIFNEEKGCWTDIAPYDPDYVTIEPAFLLGYDPKLDLKISPHQSRILHSVDERDREQVEALPENLRMQFKTKGAKIPLHPSTSLFLPRRTSINDSIGTSLYTRIIPFYALENNLITGTLIASLRRQRAILHLEIGIEDKWEPDPDEVNQYLDLFMQADDDPQGAIVGTRNGVSANEVRQATDFWKLSEDIEMINSQKMKALAVNETFLSGEATYNTLETALSVFIEMIKNLRDNLTQKMFYHKVFPALARAYGITKPKERDLSHRIRVKKSEEEKEQEIQQEVKRSLEYVKASEGKQIPESDLLIPQIHWHKELKPQADDNYLNILEKMEEKGLPIPLRTWAAVGGVDLEKLLDMIEDDKRVREDIKDARRGLDDQQDSLFAEVLSSKTKLMNMIPVWGKTGSFLGLKKEEANSMLKELSEEKHPARIITSEKRLDRWIHERTGNDNKTDAMRFVLKRVGLSSIPVEKRIVKAAIEKMDAESDLSASKRQLELNLLRGKVQRTPDEDLDKVVEGYVKKPDPFVGNKASYLYSGINL